MIGLLWFDESGTLEQRVERAVRRYTEKFGRRPTVCYVHPSMLNEPGPTLAAGVRLAPRRSVLRDHFFVVREEDATIDSRAGFPCPAPDAGGDALDQAGPGRQWMQSPLLTVEKMP